MVDFQAQNSANTAGQAQDPNVAQAPEVQGGIFGGSAEAVDKMVEGNQSNSALNETLGSAPEAASEASSDLDFAAAAPEPVAPEAPADDNGETFNFDEISFDQAPKEEPSKEPKEDVSKPKVETPEVESPVEETPQEVTKPEISAPVEPIEEPLQENIPEPVEAVEEHVMPQEEASMEAVTPEAPFMPEDELDDHVVQEDKPQEETVKQAVETKQYDDLHEVFDDTYEQLETAYEMLEKDAGDLLMVPESEYDFLIKDFGKDTFYVHKGEVNISFSLESGALEVFVNDQLLFSEGHLHDNPEERDHVMNKMTKFLGIIQGFVTNLKEEEQRKADEAKRGKLMDEFKNF